VNQLPFISTRQHASECNAGVVLLAFELHHEIPDHLAFQLDFLHLSGMEKHRSHQKAHPLATDRNATSPVILVEPATFPTALWSTREYSAQTMHVYRTDPDRGAHTVRHWSKAIPRPARVFAFSRNNRRTVLKRITRAMPYMVAGRMERASHALRSLPAIRQPWLRTLHTTSRNCFSATEKAGTVGVA